MYFLNNELGQKLITRNFSVLSRMFFENLWVLADNDLLLCHGTKTSYIRMPLSKAGF
jgi:hypothetical protein